MARKTKLKPLLPTLKEKKRYLAFEIVSKGKIRSFSSVSKAIWASMLSFVGSLGVARAGLQIFPDKFDSQSQRGLLKVAHTSVDCARASLALIDEIDGKQVIVRSLGASGIMKKAYEKYVLAKQKQNIKFTGFKAKGKALNPGIEGGI
ncbi:hypothetical protein D6825_00840 [Candidatus Woesearchaeota archaeon]|nr:MAG: hypothetical protein D6825_00840 [Candidatus Woesearchaeota archaeon]